MGTVARRRRAFRHDRVVAAPLAIGAKVAVPTRMKDVRRAKSDAATECQQHLREDGVLMGEVEPEVLERGRGVRVDGLGDQQAAGFEAPIREAEKGEQARVRKVLDDLSGENCAERVSRKALEIVDDVGLLDLQPFGAGARDHPRVEIDAPRGNPGLPHQLEELAPSAAGVEHRLPTGEKRDVGALTVADHILGEPEYLFERQIVLIGRNRRRLVPVAEHAARPASVEPLEPERCMVRCLPNSRRQRLERVKATLESANLLLSRSRRVGEARLERGDQRQELEVNLLLMSSMGST